MKNWPLRWKIAFYAAVFGVVATFAGAATTWLLMRRSEIRAFDQRLAIDARELFRDIANFGTGWSTNQQAIHEIFVPLALRDRFVQIHGSGGELLYLSPNLNTAIVDDGIENFHTRRIGNRSIRVAKFHHGGLTAFVGADIKEINAMGRDIILGMFGAIPTVLFVVALGARWVAGRALGPVEEISQAAARITPQRLDERLPVPAAKDEIAGLVTILNNTFERLQRSFEQSVRFSADASHHLKTPLAVLRAGIEQILTDPNSSPTEQTRANVLLDQVHRLTSVSENLLLLARADAGRLELKREHFDFHDVLDGAREDLETLAKSENISIETNLERPVPLYADRFSVSLIVQNLIHNAVKFNRPAGTIQLALSLLNGKVQLRVANKGEPIPKERAQHIFERFYRLGTSRDASGHGLGLSIARELAIAHGGDLILLRSDEEWTEFQLTLPGGPAP
ncbi:MAG TPA: ATP-binding protein [Chthoniobacterales bacterium]|nr:ATP-binding protein [Chthoniobacterales bacterium]